MIVSAIKWVKDIPKKKGMLNFIAVLLTIFTVLTSLNAYAADDSIPKIDIVQGYKTQTELTKSATGDPSYNAQTTTNNVALGALSGIVQELVPQVLTTYDDIQANANLPTYAKNGVVGMADNAIVSMYKGYDGVNIPKYLASEWVPGYDTSSNSIYAASDGYSYLQETNVNSLWDRIRLISYVFFVVVLIAAGFMIMFRQKIGGQLAVSVFNTLPNVIIALILVTFSFAIVGLILNFGVMLINIISSLLGITSANAITVDNPFSLWTVLFNGDFWQQNMSGNLTTLLVPTAIGALIGLSNPVSGSAALGALAVGSLFALLIAIIVSAIIIFASIRVYMTLLTAFLSIILNTVLAPIFLSISAFPGQSNMAQDWFNRVLKAALTFPIVYFFLNLGLFVLKGDINLGFPSGIMSGDFNSVPTGGTLVGAFLKSVLVIVMFFYAADAPKMMDDFIVTNSGKGAQGAIDGMKKGLSKIPIVGSFFS